MNKICTSIEQSKKLAEFLPLESADMEYMFLKKDGSKVSNVPFVKDGFEEPECCYIFIPCWSLAALLNLLPDSIYDNTNEFSQLDFTKKSVAYIHGTTDAIKIGTLKDNLVDACVEMILKLHELNLL